MNRKPGSKLSFATSRRRACKKYSASNFLAWTRTRRQLDAALDFAREGDVLVITKIDRIARSVAHLCEIEAKLQAKGASLKVLTPQLDTSTSIGRPGLQHGRRHRSI